jgi:hypothetical protein
MPFTGDLEHLSIIDVVQLLHSTRKSGTLAVRGDKGECQLVFDEGFIVSANHFDNSLRIGRILVEAGALPEAALNETLREQAAAGPARRPLVAALIESGRVGKEEAYRGLETLLELTIVEVLTWKRGSFTLDVGKVDAADEYRYFPERLHQKTRFHTENILMEALRIYDEKKRDGTLPETAPGAGGDGVLSADDLGLGDVERMERRIPGVFKALEDGPPGAHRAALDRLAPDLPDDARERLATLLDRLPPRPHAREGAPPFVVLFSGDDLLGHCLVAACRHAGIFVLATSEEQDIDPILAQSRAREGFPVLLIDAPSGDHPRFSPEALAGLRLRARQRGLCTIQLACREAPAPFDAAPGGIVAVLGLPRPERRDATFVDDLPAFLAAVPAALEEHARSQRDWFVASVRGGLDALRDAREPAAAPLSMLRAVARGCERALTLIVRGSGLVPELGIGFVAGAGREPRPLAGPATSLPIGAGGLLAAILADGRCRRIPAGDAALGPLIARIGAPRHPEALLLPLRAAGRTVSLTYADFGPREATPVDLDLLDALASRAGAELEAILRRARAQTASTRPGASPTPHQAGVSPWT